MASKRKLRVSANCTQAVIWSRVSSIKQSDGVSLSAQEAKNKQYCKEKGLKIIKSFSVIESSTKEKRPEFDKMLEFVTSQKKKTAIVCYCVDRFQRNNNPDQIINKLIAEDKIELHFSNDRFDINILTQGGDNMRFDVSKLSSKWYIESMKIAQERSIIANLNNGVWLSRAPIGYLNNRIAKRKSIVIKDEILAPRVVALFKEYATGKHSLATLTELATDIGLTSPYSKDKKPLTKQSIHALLKNYFYCGYMKNAEEVLIKHTAGPIISKDLFDKVQNVLTGKKENNIKTTYKSIPFAFRGIIKCKCCGRVMNTERHFIKSENREVNYLRCATPRPACTQKPIREEELFNLLKREVFASTLDLTNKMKKSLMISVKKQIKLETLATKNIKSSISLQINDLKAKEDKLLNLFLDAKINEDKYDKLKTDVENEITTLENNLQRYLDIDIQTQQKFEVLFEKALNISNIIETAGPDKLNQLFGLLFEDCQLSGTNFKYNIRRPFETSLSVEKSVA